MNKSSEEILRIANDLPLEHKKSLITILRKMNLELQGKCDELDSILTDVDKYATD